MNGRYQMTYFKTAEKYLYYIGLFLYVLSYNIQYSYAHNDWIVAQSPALMIIKLMRYTAYLFCALHLVTMYKVNMYTVGAAVIPFPDSHPIHAERDSFCCSSICNIHGAAKSSDFLFGYSYYRY